MYGLKAVSGFGCGFGIYSSHPHQVKRSFLELMRAIQVLRGDEGCAYRLFCYALLFSPAWSGDYMMRLLDILMTIYPDIPNAAEDGAVGEATLLLF